MNKYKISLIGEPESLRNKISDKLSKFWGIKSIKLSDLTNKDTLDEDDISRIRLKTALIAEDDEGFILNGFPLSKDDCNALQNIDLVIFFNLTPDDTIKLHKDRRWCPTCFRTYHLVQKPPIKEDICDRCGSRIIIMKEDDSRTIDNTITSWYIMHQDVLQHFREIDKILEIVDNEDADDICSQISRILKGKIKPKIHRIRKRFKKVF